MNVAAFLRQFPEFAETADVIVQAKLTLAAVRMGGPDTSVWGAFAGPSQPLTLADLAHGYLAAHYLALSPFGTETRLEPGKARTTYLEVWEDLVQSLAPGILVAGGS